MLRIGSSWEPLGLDLFAYVLPREMKLTGIELIKYLFAPPPKNRVVFLNEAWEQVYIHCSCHKERQKFNFVMSSNHSGYSGYLQIMYVDFGVTSIASWLGWHLPSVRSVSKPHPGRSKASPIYEASPAFNISHAAQAVRMTSVVALPLRPL